jgi:hypothetical protein
MVLFVKKKLLLNFWFHNKELELAKENSEACMTWIDACPVIEIYK